MLRAAHAGASWRWGPPERSWSWRCSCNRCSTGARQPRYWWFTVRDMVVAAIQITMGGCRRRCGRGQAHQRINAKTSPCREQKNPLIRSQVQDGRGWPPGAVITGMPAAARGCRLAVVAAPCASDGRGSSKGAERPLGQTLMSTRSPGVRDDAVAQCASPSRGDDAALTLPRRQELSPSLFARRHPSPWRRRAPV